MAELRVELYGHLVGHLYSSGDRAFDFRTDPAAFEHFRLGSTALSVSVPLSVVDSRGKAGRRRVFFTELLPEGNMLADMALRAGVAEHDVVGFLAHYGRDVAGAVQIWDPDLPGEPRTPRATAVTHDEVGAMLQDTRSAPLGNSPVSGKSSLAGVQEKIVLARVDGEWHRVHDGYPSTHIVKPETREHSSLIYDEEYGTRVARATGLTSHASWVEDFPGRPGLVIERYDRSPDAPQMRIHQEDMNQALGAVGNQKYQEYGGKVSLARVAEVLARVTDDDSQARLLRMTTFAVAIGNLDMHAKNISLIHRPDQTTTLAPAYDVVPLRQHPTDGRLALAVNKKYVHATITAEDVAAEGGAWGVPDPETVVRETLEAILIAVETEEPDRRADPKLREAIRAFTQNLLSGNPVS
ncbi:type II toxin-antitoxin system HipA family toxin [Promicromonospora thailandica]|uniref:Serine/threonine-protein kinase HipA n=1 Tax=Promicromonospora thailandica TaxID=765201 RepID=A0A9X2JVD2_9MICO|nr:HipA domain-containing protein [Promicromonospora thailandica]MCP2264961.1 serine/threonine-protein kinase HipA [Promicromonospora thailandica]BFF18759.1 type II toxin-antitoxin system HipA family toxin [Promicromonospora thailandica]